MKIAIVTGGSRGLGKSMSLRLAQKGHDVILTYNHKASEADSVVAQIRNLGREALALQLDVADHRSFPAFAEKVKAALVKNWQRDDFDFLINNAGIGIHASFMDTTEAQFDQLVNIHFKGAFFLTQKLLPLMKDGGRIVNISSGLARFSLPGYAAYAAMKGAIEVLTRYQAKELGPRKITVNVVAPGAIETDFGGGAVRDNKQINDFIASQTSLGRVGLPDDIGDAVASLLSDDNRWINGQRIEASGGIFL
jgi:NAD(P)-dependent dehydrogenase (short-subunit alcohol dehydrogenase family)